MNDSNVINFDSMLDMNDSVHDTIDPDANVLSNFNANNIKHIIHHFYCIISFQKASLFLLSGINVNIVRIIIVDDSFILFTILYNVEILNPLTYHVR